MLDGRLVSLCCGSTSALTRSLSVPVPDQACVAHAKHKLPTAFSYQPATSILRRCPYPDSCPCSHLCPHEQASPISSHFYHPILITLFIAIPSQVLMRCLPPRAYLELLHATLQGSIQIVAADCSTCSGPVGIQAASVL